MVILFTLLVYMLAAIGAAAIVFVILDGTWTGRKL
jgi:hypothetical protein